MNPKFKLGSSIGAKSSRSS